MKKIKYENIVAVLLEEFPEFEQSNYYDHESEEFQYATMGDFGRFLNHLIEREASHIELIKRAFKFINDIYNGSQVSNGNQSDTIQNLLYIEIFENLAQTKFGVKAARKYLLNKAKNDFETVFRYTGVETSQQ